MDCLPSANISVGCYLPAPGCLTEAEYKYSRCDILLHRLDHKTVLSEGATWALHDYDGGQYKNNS
jgi:hypothetical protein